MSASWKDRYTEKQLENKRLADRLGQQRLRRESKRAVAELKQRLQLSVRGENAALIHQLLNENARLHSAVNHYRSRLEDIMAWSQECLSYDTSCKETAVVSSHHERQTGDSRPCQNTPVIIAQRVPPISRHLSIYIKAISLTGEPGAVVNNGVTMEALLELVTAWKLSNNDGFGSEFVFELFALNESYHPRCTPDEIEWQISSPHFYHHLLQALNLSEPLPRREVDQPHRLPLPPLPKVERLRRMAALCTYEAIREWKPFYASSYEWAAIFWSTFKYLEFLNFPTIGTLNETPPCLWPSRTQLSMEHPSFVDFLIWPRLRDTLTANSLDYEPTSLVLDLVLNFELAKTAEVSKQPIFILTTGTPGIELNTAMREIVYNVNNFRVHQGFKCKYPDLELYFPTENNGTTDQGHLSGTAPIENSSKDLDDDYLHSTLREINNNNVNQTVPSAPRVDIARYAEARESLPDAPCMNWRAVGVELEPANAYEHITFAENSTNGVGSDLTSNQDQTFSIWPSTTKESSMSSALVDFVFEWDMENNKRC